MGDAEVEELRHLLVEKVENEGVWPSPLSQGCCIYRVPSRLRRLNPDAYTPQLLLIGPLHHSKKAKASLLLQQYLPPSDENERTKSKYLDYLNMEHQKKVHLNWFIERVGIENVKQIRRAIKEDEGLIRQSYAEVLDWIKSTEFVDMILLDSVFILVLFLRDALESTNEDLFISDTFCHQITLNEDLMLLENQLPYFILEKLFDPILRILTTTNGPMMFRKLTLKYFALDNAIKDNTKFKHFTDMFRCLSVQTLDLSENNRELIQEEIGQLYNADKLNSAGVEFKKDGPAHSIEVKFDKGCLRMPLFFADDEFELRLRNIMALEQCHYPSSPYVCNYIAFLDALIDTNKDVDLLIEKGIVINWMGHQGSVVEVMNRLCIGLAEENSYYYEIAKKLNQHYENPINKSCATLRRAYFTNLWTTTATLTAITILVLTIIQALASVIQARQGGNKNSSK